MADTANNGEIVFYQRDSGKPVIEVRMDGGSVWLTQAQMAELFQTTPQNITLHLKAIFAEGELTESATCKDYLQVRQEGARQVERNLRRRPCRRKLPERISHEPDWWAITISQCLIHIEKG